MGRILWGSQSSIRVIDPGRFISSGDRQLRFSLAQVSRTFNGVVASAARSSNAPHDGQNDLNHVCDRITQLR